MKTATAETAFVQIAEAAEKIKSDETATVGTVSPGDVIRQGDLYVIALRQLPEKKKEIAERQLAPGTSQGSRHVLVGDCEVFDADKGQVNELIRHVVPKAGVDAALIGPVFRTLGPTALTHPEHGDRVLPTGECFAVVYQRALADVVRRVQD